MNKVADDDESLTNAYQRIGSLEQRLKVMTALRTEDGLDGAALECARAINDIFATGHRGGVAQRTSKVQIVIREQMRRMLFGEKHWAADVLLRSGGSINPHIKG